MRILFTLSFVFCVISICNANVYAEINRAKSVNADLGEPSSHSSSKKNISQEIDDKVSFQVIEAIGVSEISQEDANNKARAELAQQISTKIEVNNLLMESETTQNEKSDYNKKYLIKNNLKSEMELRGVLVTPLGKEGKFFRSKASLNKKDWVKNLKYQIQELKEEIEKYAGGAKKAIDHRLYKDANDYCVSLSGKFEEYREKRNELERLGGLDSDVKITTQYEGLENELINRLSKLTIALDQESYVVDIQNPDVKIGAHVADEYGVLNAFPLQLVQDGVSLSKKRTGSDGHVDLKGLLKIDKSSRVPQIYVKASDFDEIISKNSGLGLGEKVQVTYKIDNEIVSSEKYHNTNSRAFLFSSVAVGAVSISSFAVGYLYFNKSAVDLSKDEPQNANEYKSNRDEIESLQTGRNIMYGVGALLFAVSSTLFVLHF